MSISINFWMSKSIYREAKIKILKIKLPKVEISFVFQFKNSSQWRMFSNRFFRYKTFVGKVEETFYFS
eukprot:UN01475